MLTGVAPPRIVFCDTETSSLRHDRRAWEIGLIIRDPDRPEAERRWFIDPDDLDLGNADLKSLNIGGFYQRHPHATHRGRADRPVDVYREQAALAEVEAATRNAVIVGAVPWFDTETLATRMRAHGICPAWHYHLCDVETLAAGALRLPPPWNFATVLDAYGLTYPVGELHTALGDARQARNLFDAVMASVADAKLADVYTPTTGIGTTT